MSESVVHIIGGIGVALCALAFLLVVIQGGFVVAAAIAADGAVKQFSTASFTWRQPVAAITCAGAILVPLLGGAGYALVRDPQGVPFAAHAR